MEERTHRRQMAGSLAVALIIVALVIAAVTVQLGPTSVAELDAAEEAREQRSERAEEAAEAREELAEERHEARED